MKNKTVRLLAVELLTRVESQGTYSNLALNKVIEENNFSVKDTKLLTTIVYGVIQHKLTLEYWLEPFIKKANKLQLWVKELLLVSLYQMVYLDKIPDRAVFNESIEIAKIKGHTGIRKFVTGVLHSIRRNGLREVNEIDNDITRLSIGTSTPEWLVEELIKELGITKVESILDTINTSPKHSVRINTHKVNKQILVNELKNDGYTIRESEVTPDALIVDGGFLPKSSEFRNGKMIIQDESAMLAVESMDIQKDDIVLDACAAPGGKTTQIAEKLMKGEGKVWALDIHKHKVKLIEENAN
ncbi:16S rRNA (cytosine(967)-C(5))-methyltransferase RsmB, partial [Lactobacillus salivarius]|nr:16S rRNA (cytosine(967)-C(5))-methyltransferase RsmB [Ligilactobacillus salivarius]